MWLSWLSDEDNEAEIGAFDNWSLRQKFYIYGYRLVPALEQVPSSARWEMR